ncbi:MAG TPA: hypothetical protein VJ835_03650 [Fimbriimonadaceae bacterium]|nr:hypothetical protein [Fimbriimonadaceae bacterium]
MRKVACGVALLLLVSPGCSSKPSLNVAGKWKTEWQGDNFGTGILTLRPDGTFEEDIRSGIKSRNFFMHSVGKGKYRLESSKLILVNEGTDVEFLNADGSVKRKSSQDKTTTHSFPVIRHSSGELVLGEDPGVPTGQSETIYRRIGQ